MNPGERKEFGRRGGAQAARSGTRGATAPDTVATNGRISVSEILHSRLARQLGGIGFGIVLLLAFNSVYDSLSRAAWRSVGRSLDAHWAENVGYPAVDRAFARVADPDDSLRRAHAACMAQSSGARLDRQQAVAVEMLMDVAAGENLLVRFAAYLDCLTGERTSRFCDARHRAHLRNAVADYFILQRKVREEWALTRAGPFGAETAALRGVPPTSERAGFPSSRTDPRIVASLRTLIENGYIAPGDLTRGSSLPGDLAALRDVARKREGCA